MHNRKYLLQRLTTACHKKHRLHRGACHEALQYIVQTPSSCVRSALVRVLPQDHYRPLLANTMHFQRLLIAFASAGAIAAATPSVRPAVTTKAELPEHCTRRRSLAPLRQRIQSILTQQKLISQALAGGFPRMNSDKCLRQSKAAKQGNARMWTADCTGRQRLRAPRRGAA